MEPEGKPWWQSKSVWGNLLTICTGIAVSLGWFSQDAADAVVSQGPDLIAGIAVSVLGVFSLYGRVVAKKQLTT